MKKFCFILNVLFLPFILLFSASVEADSLTYQLTQGVDSPIVAAVMPLDSASPFAAMVQQDLNNSGEFDARLVDTQADVSGIPYVIRLTMQSSDQDQAQVLLMDAAHQNKILFQKSFDVSDSNLNQLAHYMSNKIYQQLTGVRGLFLTRIAYISVQQVGSEQNQYQLQVANSDGSNVTTILTSDEPLLSPVFSPNGNQIAYVGFEKGQ